MKKYSKRCPVYEQTGMGLVEILAGIFIGSLVILAVTGSLITFEAARRTSVSGNSTFANAISGLYLIGYDLKNAGLGVFNNDNLYCSRFNIFSHGAVRANNNVIPPVAIQEGNADPDKITVFYADSIYSGAPAKLLTGMSSPTAPFTINASAKAFAAAGQTVLLAGTNTSQPCTLMGITSIINKGNSAVINHDSISTYNPASPDNVFTIPVTYSDGSYMFNLGQLQWRTWQVTNGILEVVNQLTGASEPIADNIIELQAQYGIANTNSTGIRQWVNASGEWQTLDPAHAARVRAVRIAIIARSPQKEKPSVAGGMCDATTTAPQPWPGGTPVDITENPDWRCYRYLVLKTVFPIKNLIWGQVP